MKTVITIQHTPAEELDTFATLLQQYHFDLQVYHSYRDDISGLDPFTPALWISLGGPMGVYEQDRYPFLRTEIITLQKRLAAGLPTLGICLGAQLIASALGAKVYPMGYQEMGWKPLQLTEAGQHSCLAPLDATPVLHWHGDTFDLPEGATLLASSDVCRHQAFQWKQHCLALQFHPEVSAEGLERWLATEPSEFITDNLTKTQLRQHTECYIAGLAHQGKQLLEEWLLNVALFEKLF